VQIVGAHLILLALLDVFLTVLYARLKTGLSTPLLSRFVWWAFKRLCDMMPKWKDRVLTFAAPVTLVLMFVLWMSELIIGHALLLWPGLFNGGITAVSGPTPTDFVTAIYYSGDNLTTVGNGDLNANGRFYKLLTVFESVAGMAVITLSITYLLEIYSALQRRNAFAVSLHHQTSSTGDAVEKIVGLGPNGDFEGARQDIQMIAKQLVDLYETHHFFWILSYFRFEKEYYALSRIMLVVLDIVTLMRTGLSERRYTNLLRSGPLTEMWNSGMHLLRDFSQAYLPRTPSASPTMDEDPAMIELWRQRYRMAVMQMRGAGIEVAEDLHLGEEKYVEMRREWDRYVNAFAHYMAHTPDEIDPAIASVRRREKQIHEVGVQALRRAG
jgi:hypothetical protein